MTKKNVDDALNALGYTDAQTHNVVLDIFALFDGNSLDNKERERVLQISIELLEQKGLSELPENPEWKDFELGVTQVGELVRIKPEGYVGQQTWHLGKVGRLVAVRGGRAIVQYIGRATRVDGMGYYHHPDMIEVLKNG